MKTSSTWNFSSIVGKIIIGLVLAAMVGNIDVAPALGKNDHKKSGKHDNHRDKHKEYKHDRYVYGTVYRSYEYEPYVYRERYYAPPPVIYAPPPEPGISIFFPPIIINP